MRAVLCVRVVVFSEHCLLISFCRAVCRSRWVFLWWTYVHFIGRDMNCFFFIFFHFHIILCYSICFFRSLLFPPILSCVLNVCYGVRRTHIKCIFVDIYRTCAFSYVLYLFAFEMMHEPNWIRAAKNICKLLTNRPNAHTLRLYLSHTFTHSRMRANKYSCPICWALSIFFGWFIQIY